MNENFYRDILYSSPIGYAYHKVVCNQIGNPVDYVFLEVNPAFENYTGLNSGEILNKKVTEIIPKIHEDETDWIREYGEIALKNTQKEFEGFSNPLNRFYKVKAFSPEKGYFITLFSDISYNKALEKSVIISTKDLLESQKIARVGTWRLDVASNEVVWSEELYKMYGFDPTLPPPPYTEHMKLFTSDSWKQLSEALNQTSTLGIPYELELETITKDGKNGWMWVRGEAEKDSEGNIVTIWGAAQDITLRKKREDEKNLLEAQLRNQQKLESIGTLASGVAHEINNPINGVLNYGQIILDTYPDDDTLCEYASEVIHETSRVALIVRNLLQFSRDEKQQHSYANIDDIINSTASLIRTIIQREQIGLEIDIQKDLSPIKCRSQQIQQVIMNLLINAKDALNEKYPKFDINKVIHLSCEQFNKDDRKWTRITVEDHGNGIPENIQNRIMDPFFTTKDRDKGTGLGLSISYGIIKDHHGDLTFETKPGEYTKFFVVLPCDNGWTNE